MELVNRPRGLAFTRCLLPFSLLFPSAPLPFLSLSSFTPLNSEIDSGYPCVRCPFRLPAFYGEPPPSDIIPIISLCCFLKSPYTPYFPLHPPIGVPTHSLFDRHAETLDRSRIRCAGTHSVAQRRISKCQEYVLALIMYEDPPI
jgi:hypothetical protein